MDRLLERLADQPLISLSVLLIVGWLSWSVQTAVYNLYFHPLAKFPGPRLAAATTWWRAFVECIQNRSFHIVLEELHAKHGDVVRTGPNDLHFADPQAYHDIYNNKNRWDKEYALYHSFGEDRSSFGFLTYAEAKERKDVLNRMFSQKAVSQAQSLVLDKINTLCDVLTQTSKADKTADLSMGFRCMTMDIITYLCFGKSVDAMHTPNFRAPILLAMDASMPIFVRFKHFDWFKNMIMNCPPKLSRIISPSTAGLVDLQVLLRDQIKGLVDDPKQVNNLPHNMTIYHQLMDAEAYHDGKAPEFDSLYDEAQALMFAGADTSGGTMMVAAFHLLNQPATHKSLKDELLTVWPDLNQPPSLRALEQLPYLNAVLKESLRLTSGVITGLARIVPDPGARISSHLVPPGSTVSIGSTFVHYNSHIFPDPESFRPERWLENPRLDDWLVPFSRGPRSCLGLNLAWMELRLTVAHVFRRFDLTLDAEASPKKLQFHECFLPFYYGAHVHARMEPVKR